VLAEDLFESGNVHTFHLGVRNQMEARIPFFFAEAVISITLKH
jgi:hypothetical protein